MRVRAAAPVFLTVTVLLLRAVAGLAWLLARRAGFCRRVTARDAPRVTLLTRRDFTKNPHSQTAGPSVVSDDYNFGARPRSGFYQTHFGGRQRFFGLPDTGGTPVARLTRR